MCFRSFGTVLDQLVQTPERESDMTRFPTVWFGFLLVGNVDYVVSIPLASYLLCYLEALHIIGLVRHRGCCQPELTAAALCMLSPYDSPSVTDR